MNTKTDLLGHPKGLFVCFATEMWERFSYYGMRALLILYLTKHWEFSDATSYLIYGAYTSLVYIMPVFGGMLADQILGSKKIFWIQKKVESNKNWVQQKFWVQQKILGQKKCLVKILASYNASNQSKSFGWVGGGWYLHQI